VFEFSAVKECNVEEAEVLEQFYLNNQRDKTYNTSTFSSGGDIISNHPNRHTIIQKMRRSLKLRYADMIEDERKRKYGLPGVRNPMYGKTHTEDARKKIALRLSNIRGKNHGNYGKKRSPETRQKMSQVASQRVGERNPFYGRKHSQETKQKIAERNRGKLPPNVKAVIADGLEYRSLTDAARALGVTPAMIIYRIRSSKSIYEGYYYKEQDNA
jgi:hypothetical protein